MYKHPRSRKHGDSAAVSRFILLLISVCSAMVWLCSASLLLVNSKEVYSHRRWVSCSCEYLGAAEWTSCTNKDAESTEVSWILSSTEGQGNTNLFDFEWWCSSASSLPCQAAVMSDPWHQPGAPSTSLDTPSASKQTAEKENPQRELLSQIWVDKGGEVKT